MPMIRDAKKLKKLKARSPSPIKRRFNRSESEDRHKKKRTKEKSYQSRSDSRRKVSPYRKRHDEMKIWNFGLPWSIKGKEVGEYLLHRHPTGSFPTKDWRWVRLYNSNCEFIEVTLDSKKVNMI